MTEPKPTYTVTSLTDCEPITPLQAALVKLSEDVAGKYIHLEPAQSKALLDELGRLNQELTRWRWRMSENDGFDGWVSVNDYLPEPGQDLFVADEEGVPFLVVCATYGNAGCFWLWEYNGTDESWLLPKTIGYVVTHWRLY